MTIMTYLHFPVQSPQKSTGHPKQETIFQNQLNQYQVEGNKPFFSLSCEFLVLGLPRSIEHRYSLWF